MLPVGLQVIIDAPEGHWAFSEIVGTLQSSIRTLIKDAVMYSKGEAPGVRLKKDIHSTQVTTTPTGAWAEVLMPYQLKFTIPPGTKPHLIPGGLAVSDKRQAAAIQMAKGYPLKFHWERGPRGPGIYHYWAVSHPGFKGGDWLERVKKFMSQSVERESAIIRNHLTALWNLR